MFNPNTPVSGDIIESIHIRNIEDYLENIIEVNGTTGVINLQFNNFNVSGDAISGITITPLPTEGDLNNIGEINASGNINVDNVNASGDINGNNINASGQISGDSLNIVNLINALSLVLTGDGNPNTYIQTFVNNGDANANFDISSDSNGTTISLGSGGATAPNVFIKQVASGIIIEATNIELNGNTILNGLTNKQTDINTNYTVITNDNRILVDTSGGAYTINLPSAVGIKGKKYAIIDASGNASTNNITIDGDGTETINGNLTFAISDNYGYIEVESDGANWLIVNKSVGDTAPSSIVTEDGLTTALYNGFTYNKVVSTSSIDITGFFVQVDNCPVGQSASIQIQINGVNSGSPIVISNGTESVFAVNNQTLTAGDKISFIASSVVGVDVGNDVYLGAYI